MKTALMVVVAILTLATGDEQPSEEIVKAPTYVPGAPPQLSPLDANDDIFKTDFLDNPNSKFIFASHHERSNAPFKPLVLETEDNIISYIKRTRNLRTRVASEDSKPPVAVSTTPRVRGQPPPPPEIDYEVKPKQQHELKPLAAASRSDITIKPSKNNIIDLTEPKTKDINFVISPNGRLHTEEATKTEAAVHRRIPIRRRKIHREEDETTIEKGQESQEPTRQRTTPPPVPTLSPWIDGYGK